METINRAKDWGEKHHPVWLDGFRVILGILFFIKGIQLLNAPYELTLSIGGANQEFLSIAILHYVIFVHFVGGLLITLGLGTRVALTFILPVVLLAVIFANTASAGIFSVYASFVVSFLLLVATVAFLVLGSGPWSLDNYMRKHPGS